MTRLSKREIERILDELTGVTEESDDSDEFHVVWEDEQTGAYVDEAGDPADPAPDDAIMVVIREALVMSRGRAEEEDREILSLAEDMMDGRDLVRVARLDDGDRKEDNSV